MDKHTDHPVAIEARGLKKRYSDDVIAVDGIDLRVPTNTIHALLGPNGAGKTTTISMLTTLIEPTEGIVTIAGLDVIKQAHEVRKRIAATFQEIVLDPDLTGREALDYHGRLYGMNKSRRRDKIDELLELVELEDAADRRTNTYSGGMKRRLELARGLMTDPDVLFLDEPTLGLDPQNRANIWAYIRDLKEKTNMTVLLTTHYMEEAEELADWVAIIDHGQIVVEGTPQELIDQLGAEVVCVVGEGNRDSFLYELEKTFSIQNVNHGEGVIQVCLNASDHRLIDVVTMASDCGFTIQDISVSKPSLDDVFLRHTGRQLRDK